MMGAMPFGPSRTPHLPEERRAGLARLLERQAERDLVLAQALGEAVRLAPNLDEKHLAAELCGAQLTQVEWCAALYDEMTGGALLARIEHAARAAPLVTTWIEVQLAAVMLARATLVELASAKSSAHAAAAETFGRILARASDLRAFGEAGLGAACAGSPATRDAGQSQLAAWLHTALASLQSRGGGRLHARAATEQMHRFVDGLAPVLVACGLRLPPRDIIAIGLDLPAGLRLGET